MSDRLKDLQRQRALAQEQLAWLEREIARETGGAAQAPSSSQASPSPEKSPAAGDGFVEHRAGLATAKQSAPPPAADADAIIAQYGKQGRTVHADVKRGCFIYFYAAFALLFLTLAAVWFVRYRR